jgi:phage tail-like protein
MNAPYLPALARPPHDPRTLTLDARHGWHTAENSHLVERIAVDAATGGLALAPLPGTGRLLNEASGSFGGLSWPAHVAALPGDGIALLDRKNARLLVLDRCACEFAEWPCLRANDLRVPHGASAVATACAQLLIMVPHANRIIVLSASTGALRGAWTGPSGGTPWTPVDAAVTCDRRILVADPAHGAIHVLTPRGMPLDIITGLGAVRSLAIDCEDRVLVRVDGVDHVLIVDLARKEVIGTAIRPGEIAERFPPLPVHVFADGAIDIAPLCMPPRAAAMPVDESGNLLPDHRDAAPLSPRDGSWTSAALDSEIAACVWDRVLVCGLMLQDGRIEVSTLSAETVLADDELADPAALWRSVGPWRPDASGCASTDFMLRSPPGRYLWLRLRLTGTTSESPRIDCIRLDFPRVSLRRYLPALFGSDLVAAEFTDRWLAIFDRGLREIETEIDEQAALFDPLAAPAQPEVAGNRDFLAFIASWVGITLIAAWPLERRRHFLKNAPGLFAWRGTVRGLRGVLYLFLGLDRWIDYKPGTAECVPCVTRDDVVAGWRPPRLILEHFQLRRWLALGHASLSDAAKLWGGRIVNRSRLDSDTSIGDGGSTDGAQVGVTQLKTSQDPYRDPFHVHAHRMSVFVPAACARRPHLARALAQLLETERPAHVEARLVFVEPRFRVGVQSMLGIDAVIGFRPSPTVLDTMRLGKGTVLAGEGDTPGEPSPSRHVGATRIGMNTLIN